jgi:hypothetical protein
LARLLQPSADAVDAKHVYDLSLPIPLSPYAATHACGGPDDEDDGTEAEAEAEAEAETEVEALTASASPFAALPGDADDADDATHPAAAAAPVSHAWARAAAFFASQLLAQPALGQVLSLVDGPASLHAFLDWAAAFHADPEALLRGGGRERVFTTEADCWGAEEGALYGSLHADVIDTVYSHAKQHADAPADSPVAWASSLALPPHTLLLAATASAAGAIPHLLSPPLPYAPTAASSLLILPHHYLRPSAIAPLSGCTLPLAPPDLPSIDTDALAPSLWISDPAVLTDVALSAHHFVTSFAPHLAAPQLHSPAALAATMDLVAYRASWTALASLHSLSMGPHAIPLPTRSRFAFGHPSLHVHSAAPAVDPYYAILAQTLHSSVAEAEAGAAAAASDSVVALALRLSHRNTYSNTQTQAQTQTPLLPLYSASPLPPMCISVLSTASASHSHSSTALAYVSFPTIPRLAPPLPRIPAPDAKPAPGGFSAAVLRSLGLLGSSSPYMSASPSRAGFRAMMHAARAVNVLRSAEDSDNNYSNHSAWAAPATPSLKHVLPLLLFAEPVAAPPRAPPMTWYVHPLTHPPSIHMLSPLSHAGC